MLPRFHTAAFAIAATLCLSACQTTEPAPEEARPAPESDSSPHPWSPGSDSALSGSTSTAPEATTLGGEVSPVRAPQLPGAHDAAAADGAETPTGPTEPDRPEDSSTKQRPGNPAAPHSRHQRGPGGPAGAPPRPAPRPGISFSEPGLPKIPNIPPEKLRAPDLPKPRVPDLPEPDLPSPDIPAPDILAPDVPSPGQVERDVKRSLGL